MGKGRGKGRSNIEGLDPESPRTLEACLHRGITMEELQPRDERTFRRGMESAEFTHRRYEFFEKRRQDKIALVKSRRADLVRKSATHEGPGGLSTGEKRALEEAAKQKAATIEIERKRVESIKRKQQQEIARIIEKEKVLTNMQEHLAHIQELEAERAAKHQEKRDKAKQKVVICVEKFKLYFNLGALVVRVVISWLSFDRVYQRDVVSKFGPKTWPWCRARETRWTGGSR